MVGGTEAENCFHQDVHISEDFRLTLVKMNRQNEDRKKNPAIYRKKQEQRESGIVGNFRTIGTFFVGGWWD